MVTITCSGPVARITGDLPAGVHDDLYLQMSWPHARAIWHPETIPDWDDGRISVYYPRSGRFPTGCIPRVVHTLQQYDIPFEVVRRLPEENGSLQAHGTLFAYQQAMLKAALEHPYGILQAPPRSGKTCVAAHYLSALNRTPAVFLVNSIDLCHQARDELQKWLGEPVGLVGDGIFDPDKISVVSIQSAFSSLKRMGRVKPVRGKDPMARDEQPLPNHKEATEFIEAAVVRVCDECHAATAPSHFRLYQAMTSCCFSLGLSATPWSEEPDRVLIEAAVGPVVHRVTYEEVIDAGRLVVPHIEIARLPQKRYPPGTAYPTIYSDYIVDNPLRNQIIADFCARMVEDKHPTIVFVDRIKHGKLLADMTGGILVTGSVSGTERKALWDRMRNRDLLLVIATVGKEGLDIPALDAAVIACGGGSAVRAMQAMPRVMTAAPGKDHAHVLDFWDQAKYLRQHAERRIALYSSEPSFKLYLRG